MQGQVFICYSIGVTQLGRGSYRNQAVLAEPYNGLVCIQLRRSNRCSTTQRSEYERGHTFNRWYLMV
jgi:hypothetical protein